MAAYSYLYEKARNQDFVERCTVAVWILAQSVVEDDAATTAEKAWAASVFQQPAEWGRRAAAQVLAANAALTEGQIDGATDSAIQSNVNASKAVLVAGNA